MGKQSKAPKEADRAGGGWPVASAVADAQAVEGDLGDGTGQFGGRVVGWLKHIVHNEGLRFRDRRRGTLKRAARSVR
jgi:hypothetical protein